MDGQNNLPPLVVHVGFAGARSLFDPSLHPEIDAARFEADVAAALVAHLSSLLAEPGLQPGRSFLCGVSQIAIGGDTAFTRACAELAVLQRVFLPQHLDAYLAAEGLSGPDFTPEQRAETRRLLQLPHVVEVRLVSDAHDRHDRFHDTNLEIVRESDVVVCLLRAGQEGGAGGSNDFIELAEKHGRPYLTLQVDVGAQGEAKVDVVARRLQSLVSPRLPSDLDVGETGGTVRQALPTGTEYCEQLKRLGSGRANRLRIEFRRAAIIIVVGHVLATALAVGALKIHHSAVLLLLIIELVLLGCGLIVHQRMHSTRSIGRWATHRLIAELTRSVKAIGAFPVYFQHFFTLPFPASFQPLLRTINVLHLKDTAREDIGAWSAQRDAYVQRRLRRPEEEAQIPFNQRTAANSTRWLARARAVFYSASLLAFGATLSKLLLLAIDPQWPTQTRELLGAMLGAMAIVLPVVAVGALSLAQAFDLEAKQHTSVEMLEFLEPQAVLLERASSAREFSQLLIETESRLLGETVNGYARRSFVGVA